MNPRTPSSALVICFLLVIFGSFLLQRTLASDLQSTSSPIGSLPSPENKPSMTPVSSLEGIQFVAGNSSQILLTKDGKQYLIDTSSQKIFEVAAPAEAKQTSQTQESGSTSGQDATVKDNKKKEKDTYYNEDIVLWTLPTSHPVEKRALMVNFTHRWAYDRAFAPGSASNLFGTDGFSVSSFGLTYGITNRLSGAAYRVPSALGRIIQLSLGFQISREDQGQPISSAFRVAVEGANHFTRNYVTDLEFSLARSIRKRAQLYFVPTLSLNNRPMISAFGEAPRIEGKTTMAFGVGLSVEVRPSVALIGEINVRTSSLIDTAPNRPAFMLGIQKKIYRHAFTFGLTNSPGTTLSQRSGTRNELGFPEDSFNGLTLGFNLYRRLF